jgi:serine/threonine-protein kinase
MVGRVLRGTYTIVRPLKAGGMGEVFEATNVRLPDLRYAVKILKVVDPSALSSSEYARFRREAEIISRLRHPNIVNVLDFDRTDEGFPFLVMDLLEGEDLEARIKREKQIPPVEMARIVLQIGDALKTAHARGIIHRDLKPSNIFLEDHPGGLPTVRLLDFGISKDLGANEAITQTSEVVIGTAPYMSPEQARGNISEVDRTSDVFSLASVVYHCLTGRLPFRAATTSDVRFHVCFGKLEPVRQFCPGITLGVEQALARAHEKEKSKRHQSVEEFVGELAPALQAWTTSGPSPQLATTLPQQPARPVVSPGRRRWLAAGVITVAVLGGITAWVVTREDRALPAQAKPVVKLGTADARPLETRGPPARADASPPDAKPPKRRLPDARQRTPRTKPRGKNPRRRKKYLLYEEI